MVQAYADATWPSTTKYELWIAKCKGAGCNIFDAKYIKALDNINSEILGVKVDGEKVRTDDFPKVANGDWDPQFGGMWDGFRVVHWDVLVQDMPSLKWWWAIDADPGCILKW